MNNIQTIPQVVLSSQVRDIQILTECESVEIDFGCGSDTIYSETLYSYAGRVIFRNVDELIREYLLAHESACEEFTLCVNFIDDSEVDETRFSAIYCDLEFNIDNATSLNFLKNNFLTLSPTMRTAPRSWFTIHWFSLFGETFELKCSCICDFDGEINNFALPTIYKDTAGYNRVFSYFFDLEQLENTCREEYGSVTCKLLALAITCGKRTFTVYVHQELERASCFLFINPFGLPEKLYIPGDTVTKFKATRSSAESTRRLQNYDTKAETEHELSTSFLSDNMLQSINAMLCSPDIRVPDMNAPGDSDFYGHLPIVIDTTTSEFHDNADEPATLKFTWRYGTKNDPRYYSERKKIFTLQYNNIFS